MDALAKNNGKTLLIAAILGCILRFVIDVYQLPEEWGAIILFFGIVGYGRFCMNKAIQEAGLEGPPAELFMKIETKRIVLSAALLVGIGYVCMMAKVPALIVFALFAGLCFGGEYVCDLILGKREEVMKAQIQKEVTRAEEEEDKLTKEIVDAMCKHASPEQAKVLQQAYAESRNGKS